LVRFERCGRGTDTSADSRLQKLLSALRTAGVRVIRLNWGNRPDRLNLNPSVLHAGNPDGASLGYGDSSSTGRGSILNFDDWGAQVIAALTVDRTDIWSTSIV
jgi:hypothetical protein